MERIQEQWSRPSRWSQGTNTTIKGWTCPSDSNQILDAITVILQGRVSERIVGADRGYSRSSDCVRGRRVGAHLSSGVHSTCTVEQITCRTLECLKSWFSPKRCRALERELVGAFFTCDTMFVGVTDLTDDETSQQTPMISTCLVIGVLLMGFLVNDFQGMSTRCVRICFFFVRQSHVGNQNVLATSIPFCGTVVLDVWSPKNCRGDSKSGRGSREGRAQRCRP